MDFLVGPLMLVAAGARDTKHFITTLGYIQNITFKDKDGYWEETALLSTRLRVGVIKL